MSEMVERVARAIALAQLDNDTRAAVDPNTWPVAESYCDMARAAIEAMREPTAEMLSAGKRSLMGSGAFEVPSLDVRDDMIEDTFIAMIDAALSEKP